MVALGAWSWWRRWSRQNQGTAAHSGGALGREHHTRLRGVAGGLHMDKGRKMVHRCALHSSEPPLTSHTVRGKGGKSFDRVRPMALPYRTPFGASHCEPESLHKPSVFCLTHPGRWRAKVSHSCLEKSRVQVSSKLRRGKKATQAQGAAGCTPV
ncbi:hypothetical protein TREES_T100020699 [Tupaia chinensis]|uniref:Uncharacterized protein n=1 Tax=Tupaia chinensis TaxID=246437 RepID=L9KLC9_TUPCH|nr:hypothetical protein TREES_T100020699 [Tupaia chinensis]